MPRLLKVPVEYRVCKVCEYSICQVCKDFVCPVCAAARREHVVTDGTCDRCDEDPAGHLAAGPPRLMAHIFDGARCDRWNEAPRKHDAKPAQRVQGHRFVGDSCDRERYSVEAHQHGPRPTRHKQELLLVVEIDPPLYERVDRLNCARHDLLYLTTEAHCPQCAEPPVQRPRPTGIWRPMGLRGISHELWVGACTSAENDDADNED